MLNPNSGGARHIWNYTDPNKEGFMLELTGTVVAVQEVQATKFNSNTPDFWPDSGNPKMNGRLVICGPNGGLRTWVFTPKRPIHHALFELAGGESMEGLIGKTITLSTVQPPAGFGYSRQNPRPWHVVEAPAGVGPYQPSEPLPAEYQMKQVLHNGAVSGGQVMAPAAPQVSATAASVVAAVDGQVTQVQQAPAAPQAQAQQNLTNDIPF